MIKIGFREYIRKITGDSNIPVDDRIHEVLEIKDDFERDHKREGNVNEEIVCSEIIEMLKRERKEEDHFGTYVFFLLKLSNIYMEENRFREQEGIAEDLIREMDECDPEDIEKDKSAISRIIYNLEKTVYNHALYEILLLFFRGIVKSGSNLRKYKPQAELMLKYSIILEDALEYSYLFDDDVKKSVSKLFGSEELVEIIRHPDIGGHLRRDPVEYTRRWEEIYYDLEDEIEKIFGSSPRGRGVFREIWHEKRNILEEKYGIEWRSPRSMNPRVKFD